MLYSAIISWHLPFYWQKWIPVSMSQNKPNTLYLNVHLGFLNQVTLVVNITPLIHSYRWPEVTKRQKPILFPCKISFCLCFYE